MTHTHIRPIEGIATDASCRPNKDSIKRDGYFHGRIEWQSVDIDTGERVAASKVYPQGTVNIAEFCGIVTALRYLHSIGDTTTPVYSDSRIAINWVALRVTKSRMPELFATRELIEHMALDLEWLRAANPPNPVIKWKTDVWGQIPADYDRK